MPIDGHFGQFFEIWTSNLFCFDIQTKFEVNQTQIGHSIPKNGVLRYGHFGEFLEFFWDIMANLGLIDFKLGLYIKVNVNTWQNKFEVHISKNWPKWPSIGTK